MKPRMDGRIGTHILTKVEDNGALGLFSIMKPNILF